MAKGLEAIARVHEVPETNMEDLLYCVEQIQNTAEQPFAWDTELYHTGTVTQHDPVPPPVSIADPAEWDRNEGTSESEADDCHQQDCEGVPCRPEIRRGQTRLIKLDPSRTAGDQWALARFLFLFFCGFFFSFLSFVTLSDLLESEKLLLSAAATGTCSSAGMIEFSPKKKAWHFRTTWTPSSTFAHRKNMNTWRFVVACLTRHALVRVSILKWK